MVHRCDNSPSVEILKEELMLSNELEMINEISYKQWVKTDGAELKTIITSVDEFVENLVVKLSTLCTHHFFTNLRDAIQSFHWKKEQVTIHPFLAYLNDTANDKLKPISMCVISDHLVHDTTAFWTFQKVIDQNLIKEVSQIEYIKYVSDGSSDQYKNFKNFINLCHHEKGHGVKAEWHFLAFCHGKGACDGTIKCLVTKASLQRPYKDQILNASDVYKFTKDSIKGIETFFVEKSEIEISHCQLAMRYQTVDTIKGTRSNRSFVLINITQLLVSWLSDSTTAFIATLESKTIPLTFQYEQYVACTYGINWWIGKIVECYDEYNDCKIMFMHPHGQSASYTWLKPLDACWIPYEHIMKIVSAPSTKTRTYKITPEENNCIELLFKNFKVD
ncbi:hypothetical protein AVEN_23047-1 [Araneus ventricosus]|uniref:Uncharacterized protein n=1 Tax=Araneus ventricosus TaxID=182803 RepID=A0A4Y2L620_ARAVE|nr:hypothetical protein AVEN_23047-1 [Araneus ventricosus]